MAKTATPRSVRPVRDHDSKLRKLVLLDLLKGWTIPLLALGIAVLFWPLSIAGLVEATPAIGAAGAALLVAALHTGLADFLDERTTTVTAATLLAFAALWAFVVYTPFEAKLSPGRELFAAQLPLHAAPVTVPLAGTAGSYRMVVEGSLGSGTDHSSRSAHYQIGATAGGDPAQTIAGDFSDRWSERRSGRRGVSTVHVSHTEHEHLLASASGDDLHLELQSLSPGAHDAVGVRLYRETFPAPLFVALGSALTAAAIVIDTWRFADPEELLLTTITLGSLLAVASFRRFAPPHPGFGDLAFNGAVGAIAGVIGGRVLARIGQALKKPAR